MKRKIAVKEGGIDKKGDESVFLLKRGLKKVHGQL